GEADHLVTLEVLDGARCAVPLEVGRAREGRFPGQAQPANDHVAVGDLSGADDAIITFADDVNEPVAFPDVERESGMALHESRQLGKDEGARHGTMDIDAE